ncbi:MAG: transporter [Acidobacteria bacterium]|nr:transporter [Acidobacteriota bacterium]
MRHAGLAGIAITFALVAEAGRVDAGPITFLTALPVAKSQAVVRGQYLFIRASGDPTPANQDLTVNAFPVAVAFGVTSKLALFGVVPVVSKSVDVTMPGGRRTLDATGLGDVVFFARYTVKAVDLTESTFRIAPFGGVKLPTGSDDTSGPLGVLPRPLQPGSGSWDGLGGLAVAWQTKQWEFDADAAYKKNTDADGFRFGDEASVDTSFQYRVWPRLLGAGVPAFLYAVAETNLVSQRRSEIADVRDPNSGGTRWDVDLGLQIVRESYILEGIVQIPTIDRPNGASLRNDFRATAGVRWNIGLPF